MSITFSELILYLLPGFLGLWVFKRIVQEDIDKRSESTQIAIGLLLGISGLFILFLINKFLVCKYISFQALKISENDNFINFIDNLFFWTSYIALCLCSLFSGFLWGIISEKGFTLTWLLPYLANKLLRTTIKTPSESSLRNLINTLIKEYKTDKFLARVYSLNESSKNSIIGWITNYSENEKEINLTRLELCSVLPDLNDKLNKQPRQCCINYESGMVIEIFDWKKEKTQRFIEDIGVLYEKYTSSPSN